MYIYILYWLQTNAASRSAKHHLCLGFLIKPSEVGTLGGADWS